MSTNPQQMVRVSGVVIFASRLPKSRIALQPDRCMCLITGPRECLDGKHAHKRIVANLVTPAKVKKGETVTLIGCFSSQGWQSIVLRDAEVLAAGETNLSKSDT